METKPLINEALIVKLARAVARDIEDVDQILKSFRLTPAQFEEITNSRIFQTYLVEELTAWNGNIRERIGAKAAAIIEESLPAIFEDIVNPNQPLPGRVEALKFAAKLAAMEGGAISLDPDEKIVFNITIGGQRRVYEQQRTEPKTVDGELVQLGNKDLP